MKSLEGFAWSLFNKVKIVYGLQAIRSVHCEENLELVYVFGLANRDQICLSWASRSWELAISSFCSIVLLACSTLLEDIYTLVSLVGGRRSARFIKKGYRLCETVLFWRDYNIYAEL